MSKLERAVRLIATIAVGSIAVWLTALWVTDYWSDYTTHRDYSGWNHAASIALAAIFATIGTVATWAVWETLSDQDPF